MSNNARRLPTLDAEGGQCPRARAAPATNREGRRASGRINGRRGSVRPAGAKRRTAEASTNFCAAEVPKRSGGLVVRPGAEGSHRPGPGGPTCGDEQGTTWVLSPKRNLWAARAQGPARRAER
jgi:hypothetical protein